MKQSYKDPVLAEVRRPQDRYTLIVKGGLRYIKGNPKPYFSITVDGWDKGCQFGGCCHEELLSECPQFADLVALHLCDIDGAPSNPVENGFYYLGGTRFQRPSFFLAARHFRITEDEARQLTKDLFGDHFSEHIGFLARGAADAARERLAAWVKTQKPRWKQEADECIVKHRLVIYGDEWREPVKVAWPFGGFIVWNWDTCEWDYKEVETA